jgi:hypothetical protein
MSMSLSNPRTLQAGERRCASKFLRLRLWPQSFPSLPWLSVVLGLVAIGPLSSRAQLQLVPDKEPQRVFSGEGRKISVLLHNAGEVPFEADFHTRLYQASTATAVLLGDVPWKHLQVGPGQTVLDAANLRFPLVKAETRFLVQWTDGATHLLGTTEVLVNPPDLLKQLKPLLNGEVLGLYDPMNQLGPLLKEVSVEFQVLEPTGLEDFSGKLAIIGPFASKARMRGDLPGKIKALAEKGVAVIWILPPPEKRQELQPSFFTVQEAKGAVVVVQAALITSLAESPQAQLNLLKFARQALHPEPSRLPYLSPSAQ